MERVVDGDTLVLASGERVRLIGVDTPETKHPKKPVERFGKDASEFTRHMVEGKRVRLELEPCQRGNRSPRQYAPAAKLGICFLDDSTLLNAEIIKQGYGLPCRVAHSDGWKSLDGWSVKRGTISAACGTRNDRLIAPTR